MLTITTPKGQPLANIHTSRTMKTTPTPKSTLTIHPPRPIPGGQWQVIATNPDGYEVAAFWEDTPEASTFAATRCMASSDLIHYLSCTLALARLKWGNLDPDANTIFEGAEELLESLPIKP